MRKAKRNHLSVTYYYDASGNVVTTTDPIGAITTYTYNSRNQLISMKDPLNKTTIYQVDPMGRTISTTTPAPLSLRTEFTYDPIGNLLTTKRPDGLVTMNEYDSMNRRVKLTEPQSPQNLITQYSYHPTGRLKILTDPKNQTTEWTYDLLLRLVKKQYANNNTHQYTYNPAGEVLTHTTPNAQVSTQTYNLKGQLLSEAWNTTTPATTYTYYADGQPASITHGSSTLLYTYDAAHQLTGQTQGLTGLPNFTLATSYDNSSRPLNNTYNGTRTVKYEWTPRSQLASVEVDGPPPFATYTYDGAGRLTNLAHENGISESLTYDSNDRLLARIHNIGSTPSNGHSYTLDTLGRRTTELSGGVSTPLTRTFTYDPASQVTAANYGVGLNDLYAYDKAGNRTSSTIAASGGSSGSVKIRL